jgi:hypothetical protein
LILLSYRQAVKEFSKNIFIFIINNTEGTKICSNIVKNKELEMKKRGRVIEQETITKRTNLKFQKAKGKVTLKNSKLTADDAEFLATD